MSNTENSAEISLSQLIRREQVKIFARIAKIRDPVGKCEGVGEGKGKGTEHEK